MKFNIPGLKNKLYKFQKKGVAFLERNDGRVLIADEMGLGKTIQFLAWMQLRSELRPAIVVCPSTIKLKWKREIENWMAHENVKILEGRTPQQIANGLNDEIFIINYDILFHQYKELKKLKPKVICFDECQKIKNRKAKRTKAARYLCKGIPHVIGLSGTPIMSRPYEIYNIISLIDKNLFPNFWHFVKRYCNAYHNGFAWDYTGAKNTKELNKVLTGSIMIRRKREEVMKQLPLKNRTVIPFLLVYL